MSNLSAGVVERLKEAGWTPERDVDPSCFRASLVAEGFTVHPAAERFLRQFGGITLVRPGNRGVVFDPAESIGWITPEDIPYLGRLVGKPLCPVGYANQMHVLMAPDGEMVFLNDEWMAMWRWPDPATALEQLLFPTRAWLDVEEIPPPDKCPPGYGQ